MIDKNDVKVPDENIEYTVAVPETGKIMTIRLLKITDKGRYIFRNVKYGNVIDMHPNRFTYFLNYSLIEKKIVTPLKEEEKPKLREVPKEQIEEPEIDADEYFESQLKKLRELNPVQIERVKRAIGKHPYKLADELEQSYNADDFSDCGKKLPRLLDEMIQAQKVI